MKTVQQKTLGNGNRDHRMADRVRGTAAERGYGWMWSKPGGTRDQALQRDCYLCQECARQGLDQTGKYVDHIIPADVRPELMHDVDNLQTLCKPCHEQKTRQDGRRYGSREECMAGRLSMEQRQARAAARRRE